MADPIKRHEKNVKELTYEYQIDREDKRTATIVFVDGKFNECKFYGTAHAYSLDDWKFLGMVAAEIVRLSSEK